MSKITQSTQGLREFLFQELDALKTGKINIQRANAAAKMSSQILNSARLELEHYKLSKAKNGEENNENYNPVKAIELV